MSGTKLPACFEFSDDSECTILGSAVTSGHDLLAVRPEEKLKGILKMKESLAEIVDFRAICPRVLDANCSILWIRVSTIGLIGLSQFRTLKVDFLFDRAAGYV